MANREEIMAANEQADIEPAASFEPGVDASPKKPSSRKSFSKLRRELSDEELSSPAVQRMLIDEIERLDDERTVLSIKADKYHDVDKQLGVLGEKLKSKVSVDILHISCMTIGAAALTYAPSIWQMQPTATISAIFGVILILAGLAAKAVKP